MSRTNNQIPCSYETCDYEKYLLGSGFTQHYHNNAIKLQVTDDILKIILHFKAYYKKAKKKIKGITNNKSKPTKKTMRD